MDADIIRSFLTVKGCAVGIEDEINAKAKHIRQTKSRQDDILAEQRALSAAEDARNRATYEREWAELVRLADAFRRWALANRIPQMVVVPGEERGRFLSRKVPPRMGWKLIDLNWPNPHAGSESPRGHYAPAFIHHYLYVMSDGGIHMTDEQLFRGRSTDAYAPTVTTQALMVQLKDSIAQYAARAGVPFRMS